MASKFLTIKQQNAEKIINALFSGLEDDVNLKMALRVMNGLEDESVLDELRAVNEENMKLINERLELNAVAPVTDVVYDAHGKKLINERLELTAVAPVTDVVYDAQGNVIEVPMLEQPEPTEEPEKESPVISNGDNTSE